MASCCQFVQIQSLNESYSTAGIEDEVVTPSKILTAHITDPVSDVQNQIFEDSAHPVNRLMYRP